MNIRIFDKHLEKFIWSLEKQTIAKVLRTIDLLGTFGNKLGLPHSKKIIDKLFELRIRGVQEVRIVYRFHKDTAVLLHGFIKKTQHISRKEIGTALKKSKQLDGQ